MTSRVAQEAKEFREFLDQLRSEPGYWKHFTILQFTTAMARLMKGPPRVSGKKLAHLRGVAPSTVSRALNGGENLSIETMTDMANALDAVVYIHVAKKDVLVSWKEAPKRESPTQPAISSRGRCSYVIYPGVEIPHGIVAEANVGVTISSSYIH